MAGPDGPCISRLSATAPGAAIRQTMSAQPAISQPGPENGPPSGPVSNSVPFVPDNEGGNRAKKRARRASVDETTSDGSGVVPATVTSPKRATGQSDDGYTVVMGKAMKKKLHKEELALETLKNELARIDKGVFKVTLRKRSDLTQEGVGGFAPGSLMNVFKELHRMFPSCSLGGGANGIHVWAPSVELARTVVGVTTVAGIAVEALCSSLSTFRARIDQVSMAFTEEEIVKELRPAGVVSAQRVPYLGVGGKPSQLGKVRLVFSQPPPTNVFLGYRLHPVVMEAERPLICFNCQRLGHHASGCSLPRACKRCGGQGHLAANCGNRPRCVNCKGAHAAGSSQCPRVAFVAEKNRLMMEARVLRHVQTSQPSAFIDNDGSASGPAIPSAASFSEHPAPARSYASVVRSVTVAEHGTPTTAVFLPKPRAIPSKRRRPPRINKIARASSKLSAKRQSTRTMRVKSTAKGLGCLSSLTGLLQGFNPQLAKALATLVEQLTPLLSLAKMLQGGRKSARKNHDGL